MEREDVEGLGTVGDEFEVTTADIARTEKTANIQMVNTDITVFVNHYGQATPMLIVARCKLDSTEYAALFDIKTKKAYAVEVVRQKGEILEFRDLDGTGQDEEWGVVSKFFLDHKVYDMARINLWFRNNRLRNRLSGGKVPIPRTMMKRWADRTNKQKG